MKMHLYLWTTILLVLFSIDKASEANKLNASQAFDDNWNTASDLENELKQKRTKTTGLSSSGSGYWSTWSEWTTCSRTCDGGVMQQIRRCYKTDACKGESVRFRICNMQSCPEEQDFRAHQCASYNDVPYDGTLYRWTPHYDYVEPCALTCRGRPAHLIDYASTEAEDGGDLEHYDEPSVIVQLSARVKDGTRCRSGSLDMCIQGKCQRVGCDLKIGSTKKIDGCGICGGDGSSCSQVLYHWEMAPMSQCSVSCGGGYQETRFLCKNRVTGAEVEKSFCSLTNKPETSMSLCNTQNCPARWIADEWSSCSLLCGMGYRERIVICAEENNGIQTRVADSKCRDPKPSTQESCIIEQCPSWEVENWTSCSVTCGQGIQIRGVECKASDGSMSAKCDPLSKPIGVRQCTIRVCDSSSVGAGTIIIGSSQPQSVDNGYPDNDDNVDGDQDSDDIGHDEDYSDSDDEKGDSISYNDQPISYSHLTINKLSHGDSEPRTLNLMDSGIYSTEIALSPQGPLTLDPRFVKEIDWSPCSVTCGEGIRRRAYKCKVYLEYSRTVATLNDSLCEGLKPYDDTQRCVEDPCILHNQGYDEQYPRDAIKVGVSEPGKTYVWREQGYTSCSASCLGGVEELIINCVREDNGRVVSPFLCLSDTKPEARVRTCNDRPCPPRWNYSDYTPCSKSCGIGIKTREVQCIHEVTRGGENTMVVPNSMCPQPMPADRQYCNVLDCPVRWEVGEWSKCSHTCGYGIKERKVECKQIMAQEHKVERPEAMCPTVRPPDKKPCNVKPCPPENQKPVISISNTTHIQHDPKKSIITLKIGGAGVVFFGTQVKIKCPVKRFNRTKIKWSKNHKPLSRSRKFKVSKKGALRILDVNFNDAGIYSCHAGLSTAEIHIDVKPKPGQSKEDWEKAELDRLIREKGNTDFLSSEDMSASLNNRSQITRRKYQNGRDRRPKTDKLPLTYHGGVEDEHQKLVQQVHDNQPQSASASSGGSRKNNFIRMPFIQALIKKFFGPMQIFNQILDQYKVMQQGLGIPTHLHQDKQDEKNEVQIIYNNLKLNSQLDQWMTSNWTQYIQTSSNNIIGIRQYTVSCISTLGILKDVIENITECKKREVEKRRIFANCKAKEHSQWMMGIWKVFCQSSECFDHNRPFH